VPVSNGVLVPDGDKLARRRALWALLVIALVAAVLVALMAFFLGTSKHGGGSKLPLATDVSPDPTSSSPVAAQHSSHSARHGHGSHGTHGGTSSPDDLSAPTTSAPAGSCPGSAPCILPGDPGQLVVALNNLRAQHHLPAVTGTATPKAQSCAVHNGDTGSCPSTYYWEPVEAQDGKEVLTKIEGNGGTSFLLSPTLKAIAVGWAYVPSNKTYECTLAAA